MQIQCSPSDAAASLLEETIGLVTMEKVVVPPSSEVELMVKQTCASRGTWLVESETSSRLGVMVARGLVCPDKNGLVPVRVLNPRDEHVVLKKGVKLAEMESIEENFIVRVSAIGTKCKLSQTSRLFGTWCLSLVTAPVTLKRNSCIHSSDVLSLSSSELGRTSVMKHHNTGDAQPVHRFLAPYHRPAETKLND